MLKEIKEQLEKETGLKTQTGICRKNENDVWDSLLIRKKKIEKNGTSTMDHSFYLEVKIVIEDEIPEGKEFEIIDIMEKMKFKRAKDPITYDYSVDANEVIVEIATITFVKPCRRKK